MKPIRSILLIFRNRLGHKKAEKLASIYRTNRKNAKSKDPKLYGAFLAGISLPEPMTMAKSSTNSDSSQGCGTEADVEDEDLEAEGQDLLLSDVLSDDDDIDNELLHVDLDAIE